MKYLINGFNRVHYGAVSLVKNRWLRLVIVGLIVLTLCLQPGAVQPARAACSWGDIICDMQQAMQQLLDTYVTPLKAWALLQANKSLYGLLYSLSQTIATFLWSVSRTLATASVGAGVLSSWLATHFFQPMIQFSSTTLRPIVGIALFLALSILGICYFLAAFIRLQIVSLRNVILWWIAGGLFFSLGPNLYTSLRQLNESLGGVFYASALDTVSGQNPFAALAAGDTARTNPMLAMPPPCSNFTVYLAGSASHLNGLDVSLAYLIADGFDVVNGGDRCLGGGAASDLPRRWYGPNGFFDAMNAPAGWPTVITCTTNPCDYDAALADAVSAMQVAVGFTFLGIAREIQAAPLNLLAVVEQLVRLCLGLAQGVTFVSFACAILFAFFKRTEPVAWAVIDQWLALLVQVVIVSLLQGMILALYLGAAASGSPLVSLAVSVVGLIIMLILLLSGFKAVGNAVNRLFEAFGQVSGDTFLSPGQAGSMAVSAGAAIVSGGASLAGQLGSVAGSAMGGAAALGKGATGAQAAGVTFGGSKALDGAAFQLARLPGLRGTSLGGAASDFVEGSAVRRIGSTVLNGVPSAGGALSRLAGPSLGAQLLPSAEAPGQANPAQAAAPQATSAPPPAPVSSQNSLALDNGGNLDETIRDDTRQALASEHDLAGGNRLSDAATRLEIAGSTMQNAAEQTRQTLRASAANAQPTMLALSSVIDNLREHKAGTPSGVITQKTVGAALAGALDATNNTPDAPSARNTPENRARYQHYVSAALDLGLSGADAGNLVEDVQTHPAGALTSDIRTSLRNRGRAQGMSWLETIQTVARFEAAARDLSEALPPHAETSPASNPEPKGAADANTHHPTEH